jgi:hypothetical protein
MTDEHHADRRRRAFLKGVGVAGAALSASPLLTSQGIALTGVQSKTLSRGDVAILRLLAAVELIEADLWQQYAELGGVSTGAQNTYQLSLQNLDSDGSQYITSNNLDEQSHATFLNALPGCPGRGAGQPRSLSHSAEQQGDGGQANRSARGLAQAAHASSGS